MNNIQLTEDEVKLAGPLFEIMDARAQGFTQGIEIAKSLLILQLVKLRKPEEPVSNG